MCSGRPECWPMFEGFKGGVPLLTGTSSRSSRCTVMPMVMVGLVGSPKLMAISGGEMEEMQCSGGDGSGMGMGL
ncbi:Hypothetical predicted protein [Olea europaea subsp. europaea]|uniref:Uncharacterized protein n=1 Tax=Olea europaea subsp. europaea TaxID=158383 RepID=A0A8S0V399_OLEEU|nr:Hypothetical predicted protein [Olea europaea subsp. europaea]